MDKLTDQQLQELLEIQRRNPSDSAQLNADHEDVLFYNRLFDELANEPSGAYVSYSFAPTVIREIQQNALSQSEFKTFVVYGVGTLISLITTGFILFLLQKEALTLLLQALGKFGLPVLVTVAGFGIIQWADYRLLKRIQKRSSAN
jgi:hypothetical protein